MLKECCQEYVAQDENREREKEIVMNTIYYRR